MSGNTNNKSKAASGPPRPPFGDITNRNTVSGDTSSSTGGPTSTTGGAANPNASNVAAAPTTADASSAPKGRPIADILSAWDHKTPAQKQEWSEETFGSKEPPWAGEEAYDDGGDVEYEESMKPSQPE